VTRLKQDFTKEELAIFTVLDKPDDIVEYIRNFYYK